MLVMMLSFNMYCNEFNDQVHDLSFYIFQQSEDLNLLILHRNVFMHNCQVDNEIGQPRDSAAPSASRSQHANPKVTNLT